VLPDLQLAIVAERIRDDDRPSAEYPMKVLAAEDNPIFQSMLANMLTKWGYMPVVARDGNEAWEALQQPDCPQLAILDWMMPGLNGVDICRGVRAAGREPYVYILLLTARTDSQDLVEGMEAGADDYLTKPFQAHELRVRLRAGRRILDLQQQLLAAREALREQATHDGLTGLLNRNSILAILDKELARASREDQPLSVLMVDLDRFKLINDTHGHAAGDTVLCEAARRMRESMRNYESVGRYGGVRDCPSRLQCSRCSGPGSTDSPDVHGLPFSHGIRRPAGDVQHRCELPGSSSDERRRRTPARSGPVSLCRQTKWPELRSGA